MVRDFTRMRPLSRKAARELALQIEVPVEVYKKETHYRGGPHNFSNPGSTIIDSVAFSGDFNNSISNVDPDATVTVVFYVKTIKGQDYLVESSKPPGSVQEFPYRIFRPIYSGKDGIRVLHRLTAENGVQIGVGREKTMFITRLGRTAGISEVPVPLYCTMKGASRVAKDCAKQFELNSFSVAKSHSIVFRLTGTVPLEDAISRISAAESELTAFFKEAEETALKTLERRSSTNDP